MSEIHQNSVCCKLPWAATKRRLFNILLCLYLIVCATPLKSSALAASQFKVILDHETFQADSYALFQTFADQIASEVDRLIPGLPKDYPSGGIICFEPPTSWNDTLDHPAPITLRGPKLPGEPNITKSGVIRVAVFGVHPLYMKRFAMQLAHELAHVKMGVGIDNALIETLATATSYEILRRLALFDYLNPMILEDVAKLPDSVQTEIRSRDTPGLRRYWIASFHAGWYRMDDRSLQTLGALLLQNENQPEWGHLFEISEMANCGTSRSTAPVAICAPDTQKMIATGLKLDSLGFGSKQ